MGFRADGTWEPDNISNFDFSGMASQPATSQFSGFGTDFSNMVSQNTQLTAPTSNFGFQPQTQAYGGVNMTGGATQNTGLFDGFFSNNQGGAGWGAQAIGAIGGLAQGVLGFQQLGLAKDQFSFQKNAWQEQFDIQKEEYDRKVSERNARVAANQAASQRAGSI